MPSLSLSGGTDAQQAQRILTVDSDATLAQATSVVNAFYQLPYDAVLMPGRKFSYDHGAGLPVMLIDGHRTYVKGMQLGAQVEVNTVVIKSRIWKGSTGGWNKLQAGMVVFPSVLFLSDQFQPLADIKRPDFNYVPGSVLREGRGALNQGMVASITVPDVAQHATYMVLYVSRENRNGAFHYCRGGMGMVRFKNNAVPAYEGVPCEAVPLGMEGKIELLVK
jgi:hypothetical protein